MNWRVSQLDRFTLVSNSDAHSPPMLGREACAFDTDLDYFAIRRALETGEGFGGTVEFFPEEGKYHLDGHRACNVRLEPPETRRLEGRCPACGKPLTVGVMHRVEELADRPEDACPPRPVPFRSLVQLPEILSEIQGVGPKSRAVEAAASRARRQARPGDRHPGAPPAGGRRAGRRQRCCARRSRGCGRGGCIRDAGYDGEYGVIRLFAPEEIRGRSVVAPLFAPSSPRPSSPRLPPPTGEDVPPSDGALASPALLSRPSPGAGGEAGRGEGVGRCSIPNSARPSSAWRARS